MEKEKKITAPDGCKKTKVYKIAAPNMCEIELKDAEELLKILEQ